MGTQNRLFIINGYTKLTIQIGTLNRLSKWVHKIDSSNGYTKSTVQCGTHKYLSTFLSPCFVKPESHLGADETKKD